IDDGVVLRLIQRAEGLVGQLAAAQRRTALQPDVAKFVDLIVETHDDAPSPIPRARLFRSPPPKASASAINPSRGPVATARHAGATAWRGSAMGDPLGRNALDRALLGADRRPRELLDHLTRPFRIGDPLVVELVGTGRHATVTVTGIDHAGVAAVQKLEE